eukprot:SAG31_NODE_15157_length_767_cov_1.410180_1_plen_66_part_01
MRSAQLLLCCVATMAGGLSPPDLPISSVVPLDSAASVMPAVDQRLRVAVVQMTAFDDGELRSAAEE